MSLQAEGCFLIASPYLSDPNFFRTVIYIIRHNEDGAFGLVVNRPTQVAVESVLSDTLGQQPRSGGPIHYGGPVEGPLIAMHQLVGLGEPCAVAGGDSATAQVWVTTDEDHLRLLASREDMSILWIAGYSGWGPGQLDAELRVGGWLLCQAAPDQVFADTGGLWEKLVRQQGRSVLERILPAEDDGFDPQVN